MEIARRQEGYEKAHRNYDRTRIHAAHPGLAVYRKIWKEGGAGESKIMLAAARRSVAMQTPALPLLYTDDDVLAVAKPEGLASIPTRDRSDDSLLQRLSTSQPGRLYVVHRLDRDVSGVILFARHAAAHRYLNDRFSRGQVGKTYLAVAHGRLVADAGTIAQPLRQFGSGRVGVDPQRGRPCTTQYAVVERFGPYTVVEAHPRTGRRHQIRVHFYSLGHPLVGDPRYGAAEARRHVPRLMLHARRLELVLPSGRPAVIEAPVPPSFSEVVARLRSGSDSGEGDSS
jgi:RluA family pseudouridine synthase